HPTSNEVLATRPEDAVEDDLFDLPDERHGHCKRKQDEKNQQPRASRTDGEKNHARGAQGIGKMEQHVEGDAKREDAEDEVTIDGGEVARFLAQTFVG